jgi:hypothetical protein
MQWFLAGFVCYAVAIGLVARFFPNSTASFAILVFGLLGIGTVAMVRVGILIVRSARLASNISPHSSDGRSR